MNSIIVGSWCVYNSVFMILRGFINNSKGKILSNDKFVLMYRSIWGRVVQARFKEHWWFWFGFLLGFF